MVLMIYLCSPYAAKESPPAAVVVLGLRQASTSLSGSNNVYICAHASHFTSATMHRIRVDICSNEALC